MKTSASALAEPLPGVLKFSENDCFAWQSDRGNGPRRDARSGRARGVPAHAGDTLAFAGAMQKSGRRRRRQLRVVLSKRERRPRSDARCHAIANATRVSQIGSRGVIWSELRPLRRRR